MPTQRGLRMTIFSKRGFIFLLSIITIYSNHAVAQEIASPKYRTGIFETLISEKFNEACTAERQGRPEMEVLRHVANIADYFDKYSGSDEFDLDCDSFSANCIARYTLNVDRYTNGKFVHRYFVNYCSITNGQKRGKELKGAMQWTTESSLSDLEKN